MKKNNKRDFVGQSNNTLEEAIAQAITRGKKDAKDFKVIEMTGRQQLDNQKTYQVVLSER